MFIIHLKSTTFELSDVDLKINLKLLVHYNFDFDETRLETSPPALRPGIRGAPRPISARALLASDIQNDS